MTVAVCHLTDGGLIWSNDGMMTEKTKKGLGRISPKKPTRYYDVELHIRLPSSLLDGLKKIGGTRGVSREAREAVREYIHRHLQDKL